MNSHSTIIYSWIKFFSNIICINEQKNSNIKKEISSNDFMSLISNESFFCSFLGLMDYIYRLFDSSDDIALISKYNGITFGKTTKPKNQIENFIT